MFGDIQIPLGLGKFWGFFWGELWFMIIYGGRKSIEESRERENWG